ncbi:hypothetical protein GCM10022252_65910 [Streptosporangium oxazolinicum]|uniref:HTH tetR-type domain-containing protein n=1 Tax=Streptosporangium oxazolinicum TaxID=909287 RepID=A0ABP8BF33_9ACTN
MAVCELISEGGLDAVTVARTAESAGISVGLVQHYFPTKDGMLLHAFEHVSARIRSRIEERISGGVEHRRPISRVLAGAMAELIPMDETRRTEFRVSRVFAGRSLDVPALADVDARAAQVLRGDIAQAVHNGKECGEVAADLDPWPAAVRLAAVTEGLSMQVYRDFAYVNGVSAADVAASIIDSELAAVFTGECLQYTSKDDA